MDGWMEQPWRRVSDDSGDLQPVCASARQEACEAADKPPNSSLSGVITPARRGPAGPAPPLHASPSIPPRCGGCYSLCQHSFCRHTCVSPPSRDEHVRRSSGNHLPIESHMQTKSTRLAIKAEAARLRLSNEVLGERFPPAASSSGCFLYGGRTGRLPKVT